MDATKSVAYPFPQEIRTHIQEYIVVNVPSADLFVIGDLV